MTCTVARENGRTIIRLHGQVDGRDFEDIESGFELVLNRREPAVVFDFAALERITAPILALMEVLRLQARRAGATIELRNLDPELRAALFR